MKNYKRELEKFEIFKDDYPEYHGAEEFALNMKKAYDKNDQDFRTGDTYGTGSCKLGDR